MEEENIEVVDDFENDVDRTFYSLAADEPNTTVYFDTITDQEPVSGDVNVDVLNSSGVDPDHIDVSLLSMAGKGVHTVSQPDTFALVDSMKSINLSDSQGTEMSPSPDLILSSGQISVEDLTDVVKMPPPAALTIQEPGIPSPTITTPTQYFGVPTGRGFVHQPAPDAIDGYEFSDEMIDSELWMASPDTQDLISQALTEDVDPQYLTKAKPNTTVAFVSPAIELVMKYHGEAAAQRLQAPLPPVNEENLQQLVKDGRLLSAVNMLTELLNRAEMNVKTLKLWTLRFALLIKLKLYSTAEIEMANFGNLDNCDLYYEFYPNEYPDRKGSIVPWSLRLLWAILPLHCPTAGGHYGALDRMYGIVHHLDHALDAGLPYVQEQCVIKYKTTVLIQVAGALASGGSFQPAIKLLKQIKVSDPDLALPISSAIIRLYYQVGNIFKGEALLAEVQDRLPEEDREMNLGFKCIANSEYNEAYQHFARVVNLNPTNTVASVNGAVCLLYLGQLSNSIIQFEGASKISLHPMLLFNLVSLYELKTMANTTKKYHLLDTITSKSDWEAFPFECLRL